MKTMKLTLVLAGLLLMASLASAQTALTQTTLAAAVTSPSTRTIVLTSATNVVAGSTVLYVDREAMDVTAVSGTTLTVVRGYDATGGSNHISLATVLLGRHSQFYKYDPSGGCTAASTLTTPWVNVRNGYQWLCSTVTLTWVPGFGNFDSTAGVTTLVASAAGQVTPSGPLFHINGTAAITGFTSGIGMGGTTINSQGAPFCAIPDAVFTVTATNNVALASTAVVNKPLCYTFDGTNKKYVPSY